MTRARHQNQTSIVQIACYGAVSSDRPIRRRTALLGRFAIFYLDLQHSWAGPDYKVWWLPSPVAALRPDLYYWDQFSKGA
jgi:hypothetical protein